MGMDWGGAGAGALTGATTGAELGSVIPGVGTAIGAGVGAIAGGLIGGLSSKPQLPEYQNPFALQEQSMMDKLASSNLGAQSAAHEAAGYQSQTRDQLNRLSNDPRYANNPALLAEATNKLQLGAAQQVTGANLRGANEDLNRQKEAGMLASDLGNKSLSQAQFNMGVMQANNQPSALETMATNEIAQIAGKGTADMLGESKANTTTTATGKGWTNSDLIGRSLAQGIGDSGLANAKITDNLGALASHANNHAGDVLANWMPTGQGNGLADWMPR